MRINKLKKELKKEKIDLALIFSLDTRPNTNMIYFTGYSGLGVLAILEKKPFLLVPEMEYEKAQKTGLKVYKTDKKKRILENLSDLLKNYKIKSVGIEEDKCTVLLYKKLKEVLGKKYVDISQLCSNIRMIKESKEIEKIKKACKITDKVFSKICNNFKFKTEKDLKNFIISEIQSEGCELAFPPIVASGKSSSQPHYDSETTIKKGFLLLDFGVKYKGYCSDMSRMLYVGNPSKKELRDYALLLDTQKTIVDCVVDKNKFSELYELSIKKLGSKSVFFTHALGHGLGLDIHELPSLSAEDENSIQDNVVFTIEPGIYFLGEYGIRIEDTVLFKKNKIQILTKSTKELVII